MCYIKSRPVLIKIGYTYLDTCVCLLSPSACLLPQELYYHHKPRANVATRST